VTGYGLRRSLAPPRQRAVAVGQRPVFPARLGTTQQVHTPHGTTVADLQPVRSAGLEPVLPASLDGAALVGGRFEVEVGRSRILDGVPLDTFDGRLRAARTGSRSFGPATGS
jgi:hypothetical protein